MSSLYNSSGEIVLTNVSLVYLLSRNDSTKGWFPLVDFDKCIKLSLVCVICLLKMVKYRACLGCLSCSSHRNKLLFWCFVCLKWSNKGLFLSFVLHSWQYKLLFIPFVLLEMPKQELVYVICLAQSALSRDCLHDLSPSIYQSKGLFLSFVLLK